MQVKRNFFVSQFCYIIFENSYQPPNYPLEDQLAKLFFTTFISFIFRTKRNINIDVASARKMKSMPLPSLGSLPVGLEIPGVIVQSDLSTAQL